MQLALRIHFALSLACTNVAYAYTLGEIIKNQMILVEIIISLISSLAAILISLWIDRLRLPKLSIKASESANSDNIYPSGHPHANERWKFFRVSVSNNSFSGLFRWIPRQTAENCRAKIEIYESKDSSPLFTFDGRWASTPEIPHIPSQAIVKLFHPDPVTIAVEEKEYLDVIVKAEIDNDAYGWNNEAYIHNWRNPSYKLGIGEYKVKITISTQNGKSFVSVLDLAVRKKTEDTILKNNSLSA